MRHPTDRFLNSARTFTRRVPSQARQWRTTAVRAGRTSLPPVLRALRVTGQSTVRAGDAWRRALARKLDRLRTTWNTRRQKRASMTAVRSIPKLKAPNLAVSWPKLGLKRRPRVRMPISRAELVRRRRVALLIGGTTLAVVVLVGLIVMAARIREEVDASQRAPLQGAGAAGTSRTRADLSELEGKLARTENASVEYRDAAGVSVGDDAGVYQVMGDWLAMQHTRLTEYHEALRNFMVAGSIDAGTLTSKDEISFRISQAEKLRQASNILTEVFTHGVESLPDRMEAWGVSENRAEEEVAKLRDRNDWPVALELRRMDEEAMGLFVRYLTLLRQTFGEWTYAEASGDVLFTDNVPPGTVEEFNNLAGNIRRIARDQAELRGKLGG